MNPQEPRFITEKESKGRLDRVVRIARDVGFVGRIEYRHVYSRSGGGQFGLATSPEKDLLVIYAEAFARDADPADYSLEAIIAHERGHQILSRNPKIREWFQTGTKLITEEIVASLLGALVAKEERDQKDLYHKAVGEMIQYGMEDDQAFHFADLLLKALEKRL